EFYPDSLPPVLNIGPGSPTGTTFGYGAKFPAKYQRAFYVLDWSWGRLYAVHLEPEGASYTATKEDFITGSPLPLTDALIHPKDGAMYFAIGGRRVQSGLYRVTYTGSEDTAPIPQTSSTPSKLVQLRRDLEKFHGKPDSNAVAAAWPQLDHEDRFVAWAARIALEHQPVAEWKDKALAETLPGRQLPALLALARLTGACPDHRPDGATIDTTTRDQIFGALLKLDYAGLASRERLAYVRLAEIVLHRFGNPDDATVAKLVAALDAAYPADNFPENWLLTETLAYLQAPHAAAKGMALIAAAPSQEPQMEYARSLRFLKTGWTPELRKQQLEWFLKAANYKGGASFDKFIEFIRNDTLTTFTDAENKQFAALIAQKPERKSAIEVAGAIFAGRTPKVWTLEEL
ncbi:MAG: heme-binding protein, partial [Verrucomicrobiae bacterium]|nr:heme-binding protein [Verrucomicrobiae bacterium]